MKKLFCLLILVQMFSFCSSAQITQEWAQRYNAPGDSADLGNAISTDALGNVYVTGASQGNGTGYDYVTIKYNPAGIQQWLTRYNGPGSYSVDYAVSIAVDISGNVFVTGYSGPGANPDYATVKYNSNGAQQWVQRYNGPGNLDDKPAALVIDALANVYVTGYSSGSGVNLDYATIKYNSDGVQQWVSRYNGPGNNSDRGASIAVDGSGNVFVIGNSFGTTTSIDYATIKYNLNGQEQWVRRYSAPGVSSEFGEAIALDAAGNIYVTGGGLDYATIKYNTLGDSLWVKKYNGPASSLDHATEIAVFDQDNIYVSGLSYGESEDWATVKYNSTGVEQWVQRYDGSGGDMMGVQEDIPSAITLDALGNLYVTGTGYETGSGHDYCTIKYNPSGVQQWIQLYSGTGNNDDGTFSIDVDNTGNVYVTGYTEMTGVNIDYMTIKYSQSIGIHNISGEIPKEFSLSQNYPNPFNPATNIKFSIPKQGFVKLTIFDILGREVETLVNENLNAGTFNVDWNAANYSSGVYFYKLISADYTETKRMVLIK